MAKFITQKDFKAYLKKAALRDEKYVCEFNTCPLAKASGYGVHPERYSLEVYPDVKNYVEEIPGTESVLTDWNSFTVAEKEWEKNANPLPLWAKTFIEIFDNIDVSRNGRDANLALFIMTRLGKYDPEDLRSMTQKEFGRNH